MDNRYPFAAIVGQEKVKRALIYNLIDPRTGGVVLCGEKGTAKSTIVRGLAELTDRKVVDLPLSVTEDMLVGSIDFERAVKEGTQAFSGGLLAQADGNILYVDEVNLLPDGVVNTLICAAASGENLVEREGISFRHASRFVLVGTMNPEEGRLRPQFLDRFGLYAEVSGEMDVARRAEIIRRRMDYEEAPKAFCARWQGEGAALRQKIIRAAELVSRIPVDEPVRRLAAQCAAQAGAEGNRCELVLVRAAAAAAAWAERDHITLEDLKEAAQYVLPHRRRQDAPPPPQPPAPPQDGTEPQGGPKENRQNSGQTASEAPPPMEEPPETDGQEPEPPPPVELPQNSGAEQLVEGEEFAQLSLLPSLPRDRLPRKGSGRRSKTKSGANKGRYAAFTASPAPFQRDLALDATLRAAAPFQRVRGHAGCAVALTEQDLRFKVREDHIGATVLFCVDASGSMGAGKRMKAAKEAVLSLLLDSYQKRDRVGLVAFRGTGAETLLDITASVDLAQRQLQQLPTGGRTPLAAGLYQGWQLLKARKRKDPELMPLVVLVTDGRANRPLWTQDPTADAMKAASLFRQEGIRSVVIDTERDFISFHIARQVAEAMDGAYYKADQLRGEQLRSIVRSRTALL
ncbi:MAG: VWA domain-containing protein [Oscillospiraceae bacterium]|nr:VWA domain-containing protein [Oscillospiraceae bacterium]